MTGINLIALGAGMFTLIIFFLVMLIVFARSRLVATGSVAIDINDDPEHRLIVPVGNKLMNALADNRIYVASACGGGGTCGQCRVVVREGGGDVLPTEKASLTRREIRDQCRLSCQVAVKEDMKLEIPPQVFESKQWTCTVRSNQNVTTFIKELVLRLPAGEDVNFRAGGYVQTYAPKHVVRYRDFMIADAYRPEWDKYDLWKYVSRVDEPVFRAYSMVNYPDEKGVIILNVRIALPPQYKQDAPPGKVSSYLFSLKPGDTVTISGPYGEFFAQDTDN
ncbi:MAG: Na(+)-translocating NADH-quinone reductase subunit F, partial [Nitrospira bacterium SG8_35_4]